MNSKELRSTNVDRWRIYRTTRSRNFLLSLHSLVNVLLDDENVSLNYSTNIWCQTSKNQSCFRSETEKSASANTKLLNFPYPTLLWVQNETDMESIDFFPNSLSPNMKKTAQKFPELPENFVAVILVFIIIETEHINRTMIHYFMVKKCAGILKGKLAEGKKDLIL